MTMNGNELSDMIASQEGAAQGLWTHTPVDWAGNEGKAKPGDWPAHAADGALGPTGGTRPSDAPPTVVIDAGLALEISDVAVSTMLDIATVTWTTNVPAGSLVRFGESTESPTPTPLIYPPLPLSPPPEVRSSPPDATQVLDHAVSLDGLVPGTTYLYSVSSWTATQEASTPYTTFDVPEVAHHDPR